jgi:hypothetical protein
MRSWGQGDEQCCALLWQIGRETDGVVHTLWGCCTAAAAAGKADLCPKNVLDQRPGLGASGAAPGALGEAGPHRPPPGGEPTAGEPDAAAPAASAAPAALPARSVPAALPGGEPQPLSASSMRSRSDL